MSYLKRQKQYLDELEILLKREDSDEELGKFLNRLHPADVADLLEVVDEEEQHRAFGLLSTENAARVMEEIDIAVQGKLKLLDSIGTEKAADVVEEMSVDDRVDFLTEMPDDKTEEYFRIIDDVKENEAKKLYGYGEDTAGGLMTLDYVAVPETATVNQALEFIRRKPPRTQFVYYCYVVDGAGKLRGVLSTRDLISTPGDVHISDMMIADVISVETSTDQEDVADLCRRYDLLALPVVDSTGVLRGMVTFDDVMEVVDEEATEDIYLQSAIASPRVSYFETPLLRIWKGRVVWLTLLLAAAILSGKILSHFEGLSKGLIALTFFIPMLLGTAGNTGAQSATIMVRALALGQVRGRNKAIVLGREIITGATLGLALGAIGFLIPYVVVPGESWPVAGILAMSLFLAIMAATIVGASLPIIFDRLGWDPALMSGPFLTTIVDALGLLIYFGVASIFF